MPLADLLDSSDDDQSNNGDDDNVQLVNVPPTYGPTVQPTEQKCRNCARVFKNATLRAAHVLLDCQVNLTAVMDATNELLLSLRNLNDARLAPATYVMHVAVMREFLHIDDDTDGFEQFFDTLTIAAQPCQRPVEQVHPGVHDIAMTAG